MKLNKVQNSFLIIDEIIECWRAQEVCLWCSVSGWSKITAIGDISSKLFCCFSKQTKIYIGTLRKHRFWSFTGAKQMYCNGRYQKGQLKKMPIHKRMGWYVCLPACPQKRLINFNGIYRSWFNFQGQTNFVQVIFWQGSQISQPPGYNPQLKNAFFCHAYLLPESLSYWDMTPFWKPQD